MGEGHGPIFLHFFCNLPSPALNAPPGRDFFFTFLLPSRSPAFCFLLVSLVSLACTPCSLSTPWPISVLWLLPSPWAVPLRGHPTWTSQILSCSSPPRRYHLLQSPLPCCRPCCVPSFKASSCVSCRVTLLDAPAAYIKKAYIAGELLSISSAPPTSSAGSSPPGPRGQSLPHLIFYFLLYYYSPISTSYFVTLPGCNISRPQPCRQDILQYSLHCKPRRTENISDCTSQPLRQNSRLR